MSNTDINVTLEPGDFLAREKQACEEIFVIKDGQLKVFKTGKDGREIPIGIIGSGEYVGEAAFFLNSSHSSNVVALTAVKAAKLSRQMIERQIKDVPPWLIALLKGVIRRLHNTNDIIRKANLVDERTAGSASAIAAKVSAQKKSS